MTSVLAAQRKTALIFMLAFALAAALGVLILQESVQEQLGNTFYITGLSLIGCILLVTAGYVWDRALFRSLREISQRASLATSETPPGPSDRLVNGHDEILCLARQIENMALSLQKAEANYRAIVEDQVDLICRYNGDGRITFVNQAFARFFGSPSQDWIGQHLPSPLRAALIDDFPTELDTREFELNGLGGHRSVFSWHRRILTTSARQVPEFQAVGHDVTSRKQIEASLLQAKTAAETANRAKGDLLAVVSHEMRTPLNGMLGFARLLQDSSLNPIQQEHVEMIVSSGRMMERLLSDLLDLSKIEAGRIQLDREAFNLRECVENVIAFLTPKARSTGLDLACTFHPEVPDMFIGDPHRVRQILINLVSNGLKFTEEGSVTVAVGMSSPAAGGDGESTSSQVEFLVSDTGIGIPTDKLPRLFLPFSQVDPSSRRGGGSGLGLAISKRLCELMGGTIAVQSVLGRGSTFRFTLPADFESPAPLPEARLQLETMAH